MRPGTSPELEYVESVHVVVKQLQARETSDEVAMVFAQIWAQAKASELTTLNVVRGQMHQSEAVKGE